MTSLKDTGTALGKTSGNIKLTEIGAADGFTREWTSSTDYYRINPFEVYDSNAPNPSDGTPFVLTDWAGYDNWNASRAAGDDFNLISTGQTSATFNFQIPYGYSEDLASISQTIWYRTCNPANTCFTSDPRPARDGGSAWEINDLSGSVAINGLDHSTYYIAVMDSEWRKKGTGFDKETSDSYAVRPTLTEGFHGTGDVIYFQTDIPPTTTTTTLPCADGETQCTGDGWCVSHQSPCTTCCWDGYCYSSPGACPATTAPPTTTTTTTTTTEPPCGDPEGTCESDLDCLNDYSPCSYCCPTDGQCYSDSELCPDPTTTTSPPPTCYGHGQYGDGNTLQDACDDFASTTFYSYCSSLGMGCIVYSNDSCTSGIGGRWIAHIPSTQAWATNGSSEIVDSDSCEPL